MRVSVFVDGNNFYGMELNQHWFVDLAKLLKYISSEYGSIIDASYYLAKEVDDHDQDNFLKALPNVGFSLVLKPIKIINYRK